MLLLLLLLLLRLMLLECHLLSLPPGCCCW
jgi:hypothetical protein